MFRAIAVINKAIVSMDCISAKTNPNAPNEVKFANESFSII